MPRSRSAPMTFGPANNQIPTGGRALKFYASLRMHMLANTPIKSGDQQIGQKVDIVVVKNSYRAPGGRTSLNIIYGEGIDRVRDLVDWGMEFGIMTKSSSWYYYKQGTEEEIKANGETNLVRALYPLYDKVCEEIKAAYLVREGERREKSRVAMGGEKTIKVEDNGP